MTTVTNKNGIEFDIDALVTDVNGKMNRDGLNALASVCVESYQNGSSWYKVYSDGWCEQGGSILSSTGADQILTFLKPFKDTNYTVFGMGQQTTDAGICVMAARPYTNSACYYCTAYNNAYYSEDFYWRASGYIR